MSVFDEILKEAKQLDRAGSQAAVDDVTYFARLLENTNKRVNSIRPFFYAIDPLSISNAVASTTNFYTFPMLDDTTTPAILSTGTAVVNTTVAYFGHLNLYFSPPAAASTTGTWNIITELMTPRNNDPAGGTNRVPVTGFDSTINTFAPQTFNSFLIPNINNWAAIDKFNTGDLDRIIFHNFRIRVATGAASTYGGFVWGHFKGYQADLNS
jgi:hypothetical protein